MKIKRVDEGKVEEFVLMGMITSTELLKTIENISTEFFTSTPTQIICSWILDYYDRYKKAPESTISSIFSAEKSSLDKEDSLVILNIFKRIEQQFSAQKHSNHEFVINEAKKYFAKRELELRIERASGLLSTGKIEEAQQELDKKLTISASRIDTANLNPLSEDRVEKAIFSDDETFFTFPGAVGEITGNLKRKWTIAFQAPMKRGKSQMLYEGCFLAATQGLNNVHVSLEMNEDDSTLRWAKRITGSDIIGGIFTYPTFDCVLNQKGICERKNGPKNSIILLDEKNNSLVEYSPEIEYTPCTKCRNHPKLNKLFQPAVWFYSIEKPSIRSKSSLDKIRATNYFFGGNIISLTYPKYSVTIDQVFDDIDRIMITTGQGIDILWFDYWDITKPKKGTSGSDRGFYDETWKLATGYAQEMNLLHVGATQSTRAAIEKYLMQETDTAEDIRKLAHVDALFSLNQTKMEKRAGIMRLGTLVHRHKRFDVNTNAMILQQLDTGQPMLDSHLIFVNE